MGNVKVEEVKRGRGRPKLDAHITEEYAPQQAAGAEQDVYVRGRPFVIGSGYRN